MAQQNRPAINKAILYLKFNLEKNTWKKGDRLPGARELSKKAGVAFATMIKAVSVLKKQNLLTSKRKSGIFAGRIAPEKVVVEKIKGNKWKIIAEEIKKDIFHGLFSDGYLPSFKEMVDRYKTGPRVLYQVLELLLKQDIVFREKRNYRIANVVSRSPIQTICLIMSERIFNLEVFTPEKISLQEFFTKIEKECTIRNLQLVKRVYTREDPFKIDTSNIIGFIIWHCTYISEKIFDLVFTLSRFNQPIAIINNPTQWNKWVDPTCSKLIEFCRNRPNVFVSDIDRYTRSGFKMGRFLIGKGHRKICYIANSRWIGLESEQYDGLVEAFATVGITEAVTPLFLEDMDEKEREKNLVPDDRQVNGLIVNESQYILSILANLDKHLSSPHKEILSIYLQEIRFNRNYRMMFAPLFRKALSIKGMSAIVCCEELLATYGILDFLKTQKIAVPQQIGICAFFNRTESLLHNLTVFHLDLASVALRMLNLIIYPDHLTKKERQTHIIEVDGMVIDRGSV